MFGLKKEKRFIEKESQTLGLGAISIIVDTYTGVNYLVMGGTAQNGVTPLLDSDGNVVIDKIDEI